MTGQNMIKLLLTIMSSAMLFTACEKEVHHQAETIYSATKPWRQDVEVTQNYVARIHAIQHIEIRTFEKGFLQNTFVDEGQLVKKGEKMFQIMPLLMQAELDKAKAEYEITEIEFLNTKELARKKVVSKNELALAQAKFDKKKAILDLAQAHYNFTTITAPFDGIMDRFRVRLGSLVEEGELLTTLSDNSSLWVYFNVSERDYLNYMELKKNEGEKAQVKLILANGKTFAHTGTIDTIEADFDAETGNVAFRATFPNPEGLLRHGETGNVVLAETIQNALLVPQKATFEVLDKKYVFTVNSKGIVEQKEVTLDRELPHFFIVHSGITEEDTVLIEGLGRVRKGQQVKTKLETRDTVLKSLELAAN